MRARWLILALVPVVVLPLLSLQGAGVFRDDVAWRVALGLRPMIVGTDATRVVLREGDERELSVRDLATGVETARPPALGHAALRRPTVAVRDGLLMVASSWDEPRELRYGVLGHDHRWAWTRASALGSTVIGVDRQRNVMFLHETGSGGGAPTVSGVDLAAGRRLWVVEDHTADRREGQLDGVADVADPVLTRRDGSAFIISGADGSVLVDRVPADTVTGGEWALSTAECHIQAWKGGRHVVLRSEGPLPPPCSMLTVADDHGWLKAGDQLVRVDLREATVGAADVALTGPSGPATGPVGSGRVVSLTADDHLRLRDAATGQVTYQTGAGCRTSWDDGPSLLRCSPPRWFQTITVLAGRPRPEIYQIHGADGRLVASALLGSPWVDNRVDGDVGLLIVGQELIRVSP